MLFGYSWHTLVLGTPQRSPVVCDKCIVLVTIIVLWASPCLSAVAVAYLGCACVCLLCSLDVNSFICSDGLLLNLSFFSSVNFLGSTYLKSPNTAYVQSTAPGIQTWCVSDPLSLFSTPSNRFHTLKKLPTLCTRSNFQLFFEISSLLWTTCCWCLSLATYWKHF